MHNQYTSQKNSVVIIVEDENSLSSTELAQKLAKDTGFKIVKPFRKAANKTHQKHLQKEGKASIDVAPWQLVFTEKGLVLRMTFEPDWGDIVVDFTSPALIYRKDKGGGKNEAIAKAIGIKTNPNVSVIDCTAGMGNDSFIMASVGASVLMLERSPIVAALLENALYRAQQSEEHIGNLALKKTDAVDYLMSDVAFADVIYLDPMFPPKKKSALVKKEMRAFHLLLGEDVDSEQLLHVALKKAKKRVVVKRPDYAKPIEHQRTPNSVIQSKKHRFDIYLQT